jgi:hypothetical protein
MVTSLIGPILTLLIVAWGFSIMLRPVFGGAGGRRRGTSYEGGGTGFLGRFALALLFSVVLPVVWWTLSLAGRLYHRAFVVFTEFVTGVHDWGTYRTSFFKYGGALFAFIGFNGLLLVVLNAIGMQAVGYSQPGSAWIVQVSATVGCCALARALMRRMP